MTTQEAFTRIVQHLRTQGRQSITINGGCRYRHHDGITRCAVGVLIPENEYSPFLENKAVDIIMCYTPSLQGISLRFLYTMQNAHDKSTFLYNGVSCVHDFQNNKVITKSWILYMEESYIHIAHRFNLIVPSHPCIEHESRAQIEDTNLQLV